MLKAGIREYWLFMLVGIVVLYYFYKHMTGPKVQTGPVLQVMPGGVDQGQLQNIMAALSLYSANQTAGGQTSAHVNPVPK